MNFDRGFQPYRGDESPKGKLQFVIISQPYGHFVASLDRDALFVLPTHLLRELQHARIRERVRVAGNLHFGDLIELPLLARAFDFDLAVSLNIV